MKRVILLLAICVGLVFGSSPETNLANQGIDITNARKAIDQCYLANREMLRITFEIRMSVAYHEAKELGQSFTPKGEHLMNLEQTFDLMGDECSDTESGLKFALDLIGAVGDFDETNPDVKTLSTLLDLVKFIQDRFYITTVKLDGPFKYKN